MRHLSILPALMATSALCSIEAEGEAPGGGGVQDVGGGVLRITPDGDPEAAARANAEAAGGTTGELNAGEPAKVEPKALELPAEYEGNWEQYAKDLASGKAKAPEAEKSAEEQTSEAAVTEALEQLPEENREKAKPYFEAFAKNGALSAEEVTSAAKDFGVSEAMVLQYVAGANAQQGEATKPFYEIAGGATEYAAFSEWADKGMDADWQAKYNTALESNPALAQEMLTTGVAQWKAEGNGTRTNLTKGQVQNEGADPVTGYASMAEQTRDQGNPLYAKDPAFRAKVEARIAKSTF